MNIARLISPIILHNRPAQAQTKAIDLQETEQTHTPISIPNQLPHCQRSYFKQPHFVKSQRDSKDFQSVLSKEKPTLKKIDSDLCQIDKLKNQYAKRLKTQSYSQEKINNKSNQRHLLKPSAAPKIGIVTSEFSISTLNQRQNKNFKQETFSFQVQAKSPNDEPYEDLYTNNQQNDADIKKDISLHALTNNAKCNCQAQFSLFMESMKQKMKSIADRVKLIQEANCKFSSKYKKTTRNHKANKNGSFQKENARKAKVQSFSEANQPKSTKSNQSQRALCSVDGINQNIKTKTLNQGSKAKVEALLHRLHLRIQKQ